MKKLIVLILLSSLMLSLCSCGIKLYKLPWDDFCYSATDGSVIELELKEKQFIIDLLNEGKWQWDIAKCPADVNFYTQSQTIGYNMECGVFNDFTLKRSLHLSEDDRITVNSYLSLDYNSDEQYFIGVVIEVYENSCLISVTNAGNQLLNTGDLIVVNTKVEGCPEYESDDYLKIVFKGGIAESYPMQISGTLKVIKTDSLGYEIEK